MSVWSGERVAKFIEQPPEIKINPNGVDIRVSEVFLIHSDSEAFFNGSDRRIDPEKVLVKPSDDGFYNLERGVYEIRIANKIDIPKNAVAFFFPRSTLNRLGMVKSQTAIGDSGYSGHPTQTVFIPIRSFKIHKDEYWIQMMLMDCEESDHSYSGHWQNEKPGEKK